MQTETVVQSPIRSNRTTVDHLLLLNVTNLCRAVRFMCFILEMDVESWLSDRGGAGQ